MSIDYKLIGTRIKQQRKETGKTQENLAESLGVTVGYVSQIERGITKVNLETLSEISYILKTDLCYFITGTVTNNSNYFQDEILSKYSQLSENQKRLLNDFINILIHCDL